MFAGDPNYNLLNPCCKAINGGNPGQTGFTTMAQAAMTYMVEEGAGRDAFVRYWKLMAQAVRGHQSAVACELANEPMTIKRDKMYQTWVAAAKAINAEVPDMSVSLADTGEGPLLPSFLSNLPIHIPSLDKETLAFIKASKTLFYAWHDYGTCSTPQECVKNVLGIQKDWNVPSYATEFGGCDVWDAAKAANISHSYWHYSSYCTTGGDFGNRAVPTGNPAWCEPGCAGCAWKTFGGCLLGWAGGSNDKCGP